MKIRRTEKVVRLFFLLLFLVVFLLSAAFLPQAAFDASSGGFRVVPDVLFALCVACGLLYDRRFIGVTALVTGFLADIFLTPPVHLSPLLFFLGAYFAPALFEAFSAKNAFTAALTSLPFFLLRAFVGGVYLVSRHPEASLGEIVPRILVPEFLENALAVLVLYAVVGFLLKRLKRRLFLP